MIVLNHNAQVVTSVAIDDDDDEEIFFSWVE
jgi:hypothetical protein